MKRSGGVTVAAIVLICAGVLVALYGLLAILGAAMMHSMDAPNFSEPRRFFIKQAFTVLIAAWGIATGVGILRLRRWAWISMLLVAALLIGIAFTPVPRAMKLIRETTGIPTISAPGFIGMAYAEMAVRMLVPLALGLWWLLLFLRKSVWTQFSGEAATDAGAAVVVPSVLGAQGIQQQDAPEMGQTSTAGERTTSSAEPSGQGRVTRSGGVTAAAVVLFFGSGLLLLMMGLGSLVLILPRPSNADQNFPVASLVVGLLFYGLFAAWGIATAVGLLQLRNWARISILVMSVLAIVMSVCTILMSLLIVPMMNQTPNMPPGAMVFVEVFEVIVFGIPLGIAIWWMVLFLRKSVIMQFQRAPHVAVVQSVGTTGVVMPAIQEAPQRSTRGIPVSILVIAIYFLATAPFSLVMFAFPVMRHMPIILFGMIMRSGAMWKYSLAVALLHIVLGLGLLWRKWWAHTATCVYCVFLIANAAAMMLRPGIADRLVTILQQADPALAQIGGTLPPSFFRYEMLGGAMFAMALPLVALYFLWTRRVAYRAACGAADTRAAASR